MYSLISQEGQWLYNKNISVLRTMETMYLSSKIVLLLLVGVCLIYYVSGDYKINHTNIDGFPENLKDSKSLDIFQTKHHHLDKRRQGMIPLTLLRTKLGIFMSDLYFLSKYRL